MTKVAFSSDWHIDVNKNYDILLAAKDYLKEQNVDIFCFAGDMSSDADLTIKALRSIKDDLGIQVCSVTGNHEMWDDDFVDSWGVIDHFHNTAPDIYVHTEPYEFGEWVVLGNMGWYDYSTAEYYFNEKQLDKMSYGTSSWNDKRFCDWDRWSNKEVSENLINDLRLHLERYKNKNIIMLSHIVPYKDCIMVKHDKYWDYFNAFIGNVNIGKLADDYNVKIAHFGHTHFKYNKFSNTGVEMLCSPLGYYGEWINKNIKEEIKNSIQIYEL